MIDVDANEVNSVDHKKRLSSFPKETLVEDVLKIVGPMSRLCIRFLLMGVTTVDLII